RPWLRLPCVSTIGASQQGWWITRRPNRRTSLGHREAQPSRPNVRICLRPSLTAIAGEQDRSGVADRPAVLAIRLEPHRQEVGLRAAGLRRPALAAIGGRQYRAIAADRPAVQAIRLEPHRLEVGSRPAGLRRPALAAIGGRQYRAFEADCPAVQ